MTRKPLYWKGKLKTAQRSERDRSYTYPAGTPAVAVELLDPDKGVWLVEVERPNPSLVGGLEFEVILVLDDELEETCG